MAFGAHRAAALRKYQKEDFLLFEASPPACPHICQLQLEIVNAEQRHEVAPVRGNHVPEYLGPGQSFPLHRGMKMLRSMLRCALSLLMD